MSGKRWEDGGVGFWGWLLGFGAAVVFVCMNQMTAYAASAAQAQEVEEFVRSYYEACTEDGIEEIRDMVSGDTDVLLAQLQAMMVAGFKRYENLTIKTYPMKEQGYWIAAAGFDVIIEGIDTPMPGAETLLVERQENGGWKILESAPDSALNEEFVQIYNGNEEINGLIGEANEKFNSIMTENPELIEQLMALSDSITKIAGEILQGTYEVESREEFYEVQKGDCLWHIAEDRLGDGTRWVELYKANQETIGANPNLLLTGMELQIP